MLWILIFNLTLTFNQNIVKEIFFSIEVEVRILAYDWKKLALSLCQRLAGEHGFRWACSLENSEMPFW